MMNNLKHLMFDDLKKVIMSYKGDEERSQNTKIF